MKKVLYLHGLGSSPNSEKVKILRACGKYKVLAPKLDTSVMQALNDANPNGSPAYYAPGLETPFKQAERALLRFKPDVVVGSSFGGALLLQLAHKSFFRRHVTAAVFLAGAGVKMTFNSALPVGLPVVLVHGTDDDVIDCGHSTILAGTSDTMMLVQVKDDHRLTRTSYMLPWYITAALSLKGLPREEETDYGDSGGDGPEDLGEDEA